MLRLLWGWAPLLSGTVGSHATQHDLAHFSTSPSRTGSAISPQLTFGLAEWADVAVHAEGILFLLVGN